jgi:hypothetical protein
MPIEYLFCMVSEHSSVQESEDTGIKEQDEWTGGKSVWLGGKIAWWSRLLVHLPVTYDAFPRV